MNETNQQSVSAEMARFKPYQTYVNVFRVNYDDKGRKSRQKWFEGAVTGVTSRGILVNAMNEKPHAENLDKLCGQFVPFTMFNPEVETVVIK